MQLQDTIKNLPDRPGVYLMKDHYGKVIYVGKARNLKSRVGSYFQKSHQTPKEKIMVPRIKDIETIITDSELEALILESNLIKRHRPKYNINLKDDKSYPYLKVTLEEDYPRLVLTREMDNKGKSFGPYPSAGSVRETIKLLRKLFPVRSCKKELPTKNNERPCLNYHIKRCLAPCSGEVTKERYREMIDNIIMVLEGKEDALLKELEERMNVAAQNMEFEKAAEYRNQANALNKIIEKQKIISDRMEDQDYLALASNPSTSKEDAIVQIFYIRGGKLVGKDSFPIIPGAGDLQEETLTGFIKQYYNQAPMVPGQIFLSHEIEDHSIIESWLKEKRGGKVTIKTPKRGEKADLMKMAIKNARLELEKLEAEKEIKEKKEAMSGGALKELSDYLGLSSLPVRIECYDVSHTGGREMVASMVVFEMGLPKKEDYRRFNLKRVEGIDDYEAMREVLERRLKRLKADKDEKDDNDNEEVDSFKLMPDLILIDGGKGQLRAVEGELKRQGFFDDIVLISLAKREEEIFVSTRKDPLTIPGNSYAKYLLQRIRDEAHRFAVSHHRKRRGKSALSSELDKIKGIGSKRKKELLLNFGSMEELKKASFEDLLEIPSMDKKSAKSLYFYFKEKEKKY